MVCDSCIDLLELGRVCCLERKEAGMDLWIYLVGAGHLFQFYLRYVDFSGTSSDADDGRDTSVVFFLPSIGGFDTYVRWKYKWILSFSCILSLVFICINIFKPEIHNKTLMPALQSPWFAPHVIVYMFAYAMLGAAVVMAVYLLWFKKKDIERKEMDLCDNLTYVGLAFMTLGMLTGAIWAKEAWGHYWAWDPKETWAAATWFSYLVYIHFRLGRPLKSRPALVILLVSFVLLQMCWYGINYLPSAQGVSVHTYNLN